MDADALAISSSPSTTGGISEKKKTEFTIFKNN
jgi:hypothetical protein